MRHSRRCSRGGSNRRSRRQPPRGSLVALGVSDPLGRSGNETGQSPTVVRPPAARPPPRRCGRLVPSCQWLAKFPIRLPSGETAIPSRGDGGHRLECLWTPAARVGRRHRRHPAGSSPPGSVHFGCPAEVCPPLFSSIGTKGGTTAPMMCRWWALSGCGTVTLRTRIKSGATRLSFLRNWSNRLAS